MQKLYYSISEVSKEVDEETHILRYWEKEFPQLKPNKNSAGNRIYSQKDLEVVKNIKTLIRVEKLSLSGAKEKMNEIYTGAKSLFEDSEKSNGDIALSKDDLKELRNILSEISDVLKK